VGGGFRTVVLEQLAENMRRLEFRRWNRQTHRGVDRTSKKNAHLH
jgi:hypothetical protein